MRRRRTGSDSTFSRLSCGAQSTSVLSKARDYVARGGDLQGHLALELVASG
jgi:hypothetical protein